MPSPIVHINNMDLEDLLPAIRPAMLIGTIVKVRYSGVVLLLVRHSISNYLNCYEVGKNFGLKKS